MFEIVINAGFFYDFKILFGFIEHPVGMYMLGFFQICDVDALLLLAKKIIENYVQIGLIVMSKMNVFLT